MAIAVERLRDADWQARRAWSSADKATIAAPGVAEALVAVCGAAEPMREEVEHWNALAIAGSDHSTSTHYIGVKAFAEQAFFQFASEAAARTLYCGTEPYWKRVSAQGTHVVDFTEAVDRDSGCDVFVVQPHLGESHGLVAEAVKALFFEAVLGNPRRAAGERMPLVAYITDEFHRFVTADSVHGEQSFLDTCRSFNACCVLACQSIKPVENFGLFN